MEISRQPLVGSSEALHQVLEQVSKAASLNRPVLIVGERGTGKELIAERLHYLSPRWDQPYLQVNCAAMSENLLESELFGHEAGAFTGANRGRAGLFERADGGTLLLDELGTASFAVQEKLLRIIEYGRFERLGGNKTLHVDVRIVAATNADLPKRVDQHQFRGDLLDRLAFDVLNLPPLRFRKDDILELAEHFAQRMCRELGYDWFSGFSKQAQIQLCEYHWPGNVRELKNVVERSVYRHPEPDSPIPDILLNPFITPWQNNETGTDTQSQNRVSDPEPTTPEPTTDAPDPKATNLRQQISALEKRLIITALQDHQFHQKRAAEALGLTYHQLRATLRKYPGLAKGMDQGY